MVNRATLVGHLGRDVEIRYTSGGQAVASFTLATDDSYTPKGGEQVKRTTWHNIVLWDKLAEVAGKYLHKGDLVYVEGRIQTREYDDSRDETKRRITEIVGSQMKMLKTQGAAKEVAAAVADEDIPF